MDNSSFSLHILKKKVTKITVEKNYNFYYFQNADESVECKSLTNRFP